MEDKEKLFKLLYHALIEIREEAIRIENKKIHLISDLFHNVPLLLNKEQSYLEILKKIEEKSENLKIKGWLQNVINQQSS
jgi:late competence protein required for DNA uptake (superfamily II DNA/RNA helicase)